MFFGSFQQPDPPVFIKRLAIRSIHVLPFHAEPSPSMDDDEWKPAVYPKTDDQRRTCRERMRDAMLFKELPSEDLGVLVDAMFYKVKRGARLLVGLTICTANLPILIFTHEKS